MFRITYVASREVNYPPAVSQVLCQLETRFQRFSFANFSVIPTPAAFGTSSLVNTRWRTETGSSYKLVRGRDINVMSAATTQFSVMLDPLPQVPASSDFGEKHQVQIGSRNSTPNGSTNNLTTATDTHAISVAIPMFWGTTFSPVGYMPTSPALPSPRIPRWRTETGSSYKLITLREKTISR